MVLETREYKYAGRYILYWLAALRYFRKDKSHKPLPFKLVDQKKKRHTEEIGNRMSLKYSVLQLNWTIFLFSFFLLLSIGDSFPSVLIRKTLFTQSRFMKSLGLILENRILCVNTTILNIFIEVFKQICSCFLSSKHLHALPWQGLDLFVFTHNFLHTSENFELF